MQFFDQNTDSTRIPADVSPLVRGILENTQKFDESHDAPAVTQAIKYHREPQKRRQTSPHQGTNPFVQDIIDIFGFDPLDFQVESWETVQKLDENRRRDGQDSEQAALFEAPTGFGKTEAFLGPVYKLLQENPDETAVIVYPRTALLQNQLERVLAHVNEMRDERLSVGVYIGNQPYQPSEVETNRKFFEPGQNPRFKLANCWCGVEGESNAFEYHGTSTTYTLKCEGDPEHKFTDRELMLARANIKDDPPNILLTTLESLELFALKPNYDIIDQVSTIVLDEVHLYTGLRGAHTANIVENINDITDQELLWLGASATVNNPNRFAKKLFGIQGNRIETIRPPDADFKADHDDFEHYYFLMSPEDGPGASSMLIQQLMLLGHALLDERDRQTGKILSFIDSISQVNQKHAQLSNADEERELWRFHRWGEGAENWDIVAEEMGYEFRESTLSLLSVYSDRGFDANAAIHSDVLLSTSFLEVGIDVGDISIITQYRTPQNLSSFIQRTGRAARKEGMDSHILTFLSNLTGDSNMFYRAERFLGSDLRTPLKSDNEVVAWIHKQLNDYYSIMSGIRGEFHRSPRSEELAFFEAFIAGDDGLDFPEFHQFLTEPDEFLDTELGIDTNIDQPLLSEPHLVGVHAELDAKSRALEGEFVELNEYIDTNGNEIIKGENAFDQYLDIVRDRILELIRSYQDSLTEFDGVLSQAGEASENTQLEQVSEALSEAQSRVETYRSLSDKERVERYNELLADLVATAGQLKGIRARADRISESSVSDVQLAKIDDLQAAVDRLAALAGDERLTQLNQERRKIFYLKKSVNELFSYRGLSGDSSGTATKPYLSLWYVKYLLRASYYFNRYLSLDGRRNPKDIWYVPPNYFESSGQYFTVFSGDDDLSGTEESIDSLVHSYAPYRSEYQAESETSRLFMPETEVVEPSSDDSPSRVAFDFQSVPTDDRTNIHVPQSITLDAISDLTEGSAQNIVRYCPECLQIISDIDSCLRHNDSALGRIHSDPQVSTIARDKTVEETNGSLSLCELSGEVTLEGVTLDITPAEYKGPDIGYGWADQDKIYREIESPEPPLGFSVDTRGIVLDVSSYLETIESSRDEVSKFKDFETVPFEETAYHTAAHFLLQLVADIGGVNPSMLFYGIDETREEVFVFERTEGGQGITDLVFDEITVNPGDVLAAMNQTAFNPQVLNERLWGQEAVVDALPETGAVDEETAAVLVSEHLDIPYANVRERVVQEFLTTADRCRQLADDVPSIDQPTAYRIKHVIAAAQLQGGTHLPRERLENMVVTFDLERTVETIDSLFVSPDIDGCVENLHLSGCISGHSQEESLSYILLEHLYDHLTTTVGTGEADSFMFDREQLPAAKIDGQNVFLTF